MQWGIQGISYISYIWWIVEMMMRLPAIPATHLYGMPIYASASPVHICRASMMAAWQSSMSMQFDVG